MEQPIIITAEPTVKGRSSFLPRVYNWMTAGLALTAVVALFTASNPALQKVVFGNSIVFYGLIIGELGLVITLSAAVRRLSAATATVEIASALIATSFLN